ncbi:hypothetical protein HY449_03150 [Candidatus Pacearchaeota archaeon]|nr:hypothetical protein [Candidatus Pacearchaeota archaeon]
MTNFIKKIFDGKTDGLVHLQFQKFSRGEFKEKAGISAKNSKGKYSISAGSEFANELAREMAEKLGNEKTSVTGAVISTSDLAGKLDFKTKKQFQGVKNYGIEKEMSGNEILKLLDEFPKVFFALSFRTNDSELKIKPKMPMSGKPKTPKEGEERKKPDFCKLTTTDKRIAESFVFENPEFKNADVIHTYIIEEIVVPEELKNEKDFAIVREKSLRKGRILREGEIDGKEIREEREFEA